MKNFLQDNWQKEEQLEQRSIREGFGDAIVKIGEKNKDIVVLNADLPESLKVNNYRKKFPDRFFQVGVAEQNMAGIATGLSHYGKIPFITSFAAFSPGLNFSQIRQAAICNQNLKIVSSHYGVNAGEDGASLQMNEDVAMMKALPNMTIVSPADYNQAVQATDAITRLKGPAYLRVTRAEFPVFINPKSNFEIGKSQKIFEGSDITIVATGSLVYESLQAIIPLMNEGISIDFLNIHTLKPLDEAEIIASSKKTKKVLIVEEHNVWGGIGESITRILSEKFPVKVSCLGIEDVFGRSGSHRDLWKLYGLDREQIRRKAMSLLS